MYCVWYMCALSVVFMTRDVSGVCVVCVMFLVCVCVVCGFLCGI